MILFLSKKQIQNISDCFAALETAKDTLKKALDLLENQREQIKALEADKAALIERNEHLKYILQRSTNNPFYISDFSDDIDFPNSTKGG